MVLLARSSRLFRFHRWYDRHMYRPLFWYTARDLHAGSVHIFVPDRLSHIEHCINLSNARITATLTALSERSDPHVSAVRPGRRNVFRRRPTAALFAVRCPQLKSAASSMPLSVMSAGLTVLSPTPVTIPAAGA